MDTEDIEEEAEEEVSKVLTELTAGQSTIGAKKESLILMFLYT